MKTKKSYVTISELVGKFKKFYPDLSASKIRFLESMGLIEPKRTPGKYRIFTKEDILKINFILKMQKQYYLPLSAIKEKISSIDFKLNTEDKDILKQLKLNIYDPSLDYKQKNEFIPVYELTRRYKLDQSFINELTENNIVSFEEIEGQYFLRSSDMEIIKIVMEFSKFGIHSKHLRFFENFSTRESSFIQQIVFPVLMSGSSDAFKKAGEIAAEMEELISRFRLLMVKRQNKLFLEKYK
ncbi:MAG: MerR family transcriptional regulator [Actinobacteria bacterium]|nr:MerR family transcriptional regulator [Cyanobacteriota bacterium]MCL6086845.1 MerR family transcriptional regulator [Actinomycetota bacterium]